MAGITLGVFVGKYGTGGFHYGPGRVVLACYQLEIVSLTIFLEADGLPEFGIGFLYIRHGSLLLNRRQHTTVTPLREGKSRLSIPR